MLEVLISPRKARQKPWILFIVGFIYSFLAFILVHFLFSQDVILSQNSGILIVLFCSFFSVVFVYFALRLEEKESLVKKTESASLISDWRIIFMFVLLFLGFLAGFIFSQLIFPNQLDFNSQIQTYCVINNPTQYSVCMNKYDLSNTLEKTDFVPKGNFYSIFSNNLLVGLMIVLFTIIFGAGAIFILVWNASIISSVIVLSIKYKAIGLPLGLLKFLIHGIPEIAAYFIFALAGGMISIALGSFIKSRSKEILTATIKRALSLLIIGLIILIIAALIEVFISVKLFG